MDPRWQALAVLTAARTSLGFQFQSVASVSPMLVEELGLGGADLGALIGLYFLPGLVLALPGGALGRRFGDMRVVTAGLVLMALGGVLASLATGFGGLAAGRLLGGVGAVLLNVLMAKMVTDWFAGQHDIVLAMAIFVNSFPIGIGLAQLGLGPLAAVAGWAAGFAATGALALAALLLLRLGYRRHPNDGAGGVVAAGRISGREVALVCLAGALWGGLNGSFAVTIGFAPTFLVLGGLTPAQTGLVVGAATWLSVASVQAGGMLAQRRVPAVLLMAGGCLLWSGCLALMGLGLGAGPLLVAGLAMGLPVGVIMALPAAALRPENRAIGMGLFYTCLYAGHAGLPPAAGWARDVTGVAAAPLLFAAGCVALLPAIHAWFRRLSGRRMGL
ncbi:MFS transporter [Belnapia sp. T18]|uniref:MFS transporter n=1 Tax=Belnapia arida TaxID=2804533 RepID=A0ABS1U6L1_9PROT|nr:MFS transporter [Belnapia arida]MBL6080298.1 MFS transporter [Belnapia arida]